MGQSQTKLDKPAANVINEVEISQDKLNLNKIEICLLIITILLGISFALKIYSMHTRRLRKRYSSRANELNTI